jgi:hypothetical protein
MRHLSSASVCPEKRLLVCCARTRIQPSLAQQIREHAAGPLDWEYLFSAAAENCLVPLLARNLSAFASDAAPPQQLKPLAEASRANTARCLILSAELIRIMELFQAAGLVAIPYKGPVAAAQAYADITLREFEDLDIILRQRDVPAAHEIMTGLQYRARSPWILAPGAASSLIPGEYNYREDARRMMVELHTELTLRHFPVAPDIDDLARHSIAVSLSGHEIHTFAPEDALPALCIHGAKDFWERISWVADIAELAQSQPSFDWDASFRRAESWRAVRMLHLGLALASELLDAPVPKEILARVQRDAVATRAASEAIARLLSRPMRTLDGPGRFRFRRRMVTGAFAGWLYTLRLAAAPAEDDWQMIHLPRPFAPLYLALRPLRLLRKYGASGHASRMRPS